ncbi:MAG TPA: 2,3-bisphosphoglycerate-independent phosphoglycerate mutase [Solirubrobacteraceae bacterium]|nr:2,3-bisphosphoglycerate-independent phosphoglycerate mutase [Solirubrobacteraceae bacterium]
MTLPRGPESLPVPSLCLIVLDGWGIAPAGPGNAISLARTPVYDELLASYPNTRLDACGRAVGLPEGQMGNSEVGHLNLGAGAVMRQDLARIDDAMRDGTMAENPVIRAALAGPGRVHLIGLVSDGGVHSSEEHLLALIAIANELGAGELIVHAFTDGRDTGPHDGAQALERLERAGGARVGSVVGRYFAMDRDRRWDRTQRAYDLLVHARAPHSAASGAEAVRAAYERGETDEFIEPTLVGAGAPIAAGDRVFCFNFRPDRMREIVSALADPQFTQIDRGGAQTVRSLATMTEYMEGWPYPVAYRPDRPQITLPQVIAATGARQLHVAETEKYPHVTYFFGGGEEQPQPGERRELVASNREVPTYDYAPEMSAHPIADAFVSAWVEDQPRFAIINFANSDMVGHTGVIAAAVRGVEVIDECLEQVVGAVHSSGGVCIVTADHGNSDEMLTADGEPQTAHSLSQVPLIVTTNAVKLERDGILADVAPTALELLGIPQPPQMTGRSLLSR